MIPTTYGRSRASRLLRLVATAALASVAALAAASPASAYSDGTCRSAGIDEYGNPIPGQAVGPYRNLEIEADQYCVLKGTEVAGNVTVSPGAMADVVGAHIRGNLVADSAKRVTLSSDPDGTKGPIPTRVDSDLRAFGHNGELEVCESKVQGKFVVDGGAIDAFEIGGPDTALSSCRPNEIQGNLTIANASYSSGVIQGNSVAGILGVYNNTSTTGESIRIGDNRIWVALDCSGNTPAPASMALLPNRTKHKTGQCSEASGF
jgi:hypothetical protein